MTYLFFGSLALMLLGMGMTILGKVLVRVGRAMQGKEP